VCVCAGARGDQVKPSESTRYIHLRQHSLHTRCTYRHIYLCIYMYTYVCMCVYVQTYICIYIYICVCVYVYIRKHKYIQIYIYIWEWVVCVGVCVEWRQASWTHSAIESCHISMSHGTYEWVTPHIWMSHGTYVNEVCDRYEWGMPHTWMKHVTHMKGHTAVWPMEEVRHTSEWVMSQTGMSHVTDRNESCHR